MSIAFTPSLFFQHATCPHWLWHDIYTHPHLKGEVPELAQKLLEQGVLHESDFIKDLRYKTIDAELTGAAGVAATIDLMREGAAYIYQGVLEVTIDGINYKGRPDLLEKRPGKSIFGDYYYAPTDIKNSRDIKREHWLQLVVYCMILEKIQKYFPNEVAIINSEKVRIDFHINPEHRVKTLEKIAEIVSILKGQKPPLKLVSSCKNSPWFAQCISEAEAANDIALIYKLDSRAMSGLREQGITTVAQAATMDLRNLVDIPYVSLESLSRIKLQATSLTTNSIHWLRTPTIPSAPLKIYFDIEGDPLLHIEYLFGFWVVGDTHEAYKKIGHIRDGDTLGTYYIYFIAEQPTDEKTMWEQFLEWVKLLPMDNVKIYHFADYERTRTAGLANTYGGQQIIEPFIDTFVDLSKIVQQSVIFPLYFYSIKDIAKSKFLAYKWRHPKAGGAQSIFWYEKWLESGDQQVLQDIINYNEDDVIATEYLHHWLLTETATQ